MLVVEVTAETNSSGSGGSVLVDTFTSCGITGGDLFEAGVAEPGVGAEDQPVTIPDDCATVNVDTTLSFDEIDQIMPGSPLGSQLGIQRVGWRVKVGGTLIPENEMMNAPISVSRSLDRPIQIGRFGVVALDARSVLGNPSALGAPITGLRSIDIELAYRTAGDVSFSEPLITNGVAQSSSRKIGATVTDEVEVADAGWRYVNETVTLQLPPGSRTNRQELIRRIAALAGVPNIRIPRFSGRISKAVDLVRSDWLAYAQAVAEVEGGRLLWDRLGSFTAKFDAPDKPRGPVRWVFTPSDIIFAVNGSSVPFGIEPAPDAWTDVKLRGTKQVKTDQQTCGKDTLELSSLNKSVFAPRVHLLVQEQGGSLSVVSSGVFVPNAANQLRQRTTTFVTRECEEVVATRTISESFYNVKEFRFQRDGTDVNLAINSYNRAFVDDANQGIGYVSSTWRLMVTSEVNESREFDSGGLLVRETREVKGYYVARTHQKRRTSFSQTWETQDAGTSIRLDLGDGQMITLSKEFFILTERQTILYTNELGYLRQKETTVEKFARIPGFLFLYHDGEFGQSSETLQVVEDVIETWEALGESLVRYTRLAEGIGGETLPSEPGTITLGQPPAAVQRTQAQPVRGDFDSDDAFDAAVSASRFEHEEIRAGCSAPSLELIRPRKVLETAFWEHAETKQELQSLCTRMLLFGMGPAIVWSVLANARIEEGDLAYVQGPPGTGVDYVVLVTDATTDGPPLGPILTSLRGIAYPDASILPYSQNPAA